MKTRRPLTETVEEAGFIVDGGETSRFIVADRLGMTVPGLHQALYRASRRDIPGAAAIRLAIFHHKTRPPRLAWE